MAELSAEDDDLLSYFLSADVANEHQSAPKASSAPDAGPLYPTLGGGAPTERFSLGQPMTPTTSPDSLAFGSTNVSTGEQSMQTSMQQVDTSGDVAMASSTPTSTRPGPMSRPSSTGSTGRARSLSNTSSNANSTGESDEKRQRRLARNRESARQSRRRKKQYLELLEEKVSQLTESIDQTRASHLEHADEMLARARSDLLEQLANDMQNATEESVSDKISQGVQLALERFGPNSLERAAVKDYNFRQLDNLLLPPYARFLLWLSVQDDAFFDNSSTKPSLETSDRKQKTHVRQENLWQAFSNELTLTYEQEEKLKNLYKNVDARVSKAERRRIAMAVTYLTQLKQSLEQRAESVQRHSEMIHSILTPEQSLRYQKWVDANQDKLLHYVERSSSLSASNAPEAVRQILHKQDEDLSVEDVTALLAEL